MKHLELHTHITRHSQAEDLRDPPVAEEPDRVPGIFVGLGGNPNNILDPGFCFYVMDLDDLRKLTEADTSGEPVTLYSYRGTEHTYEKGTNKVNYYTIWTVWQCRPEAGKDFACVDSQGRAVHIRRRSVELVYNEQKDERDDV